MCCNYLINIISGHVELTFIHFERGDVKRTKPKLNHGSCALLWQHCFHQKVGEKVSTFHNVNVNVGQYNCSCTELANEIVHGGWD